MTEVWEVDESLDEANAQIEKTLKSEAQKMKSAQNYEEVGTRRLEQVSADAFADTESNFWGEYDPLQRLFPVEPPSLGKKEMDELLVKLAAADADDIILVSDRPIYTKINNVTFRINRRNVLLTEISDALTQMHRESTPGKVRSGQEENFGYSVPVETVDGVEHIRFRVNATACMGPYGSADGIVVTMRVIDACPKTMDQLRIPMGIRDLAFPDTGIVLVTGETGSGKTTMLGSFIYAEAVNPDGKHIVCYEQPIEYDYQTIPDSNSLIIQTEAYDMLPGWDSTVPNALRRNPDIILIGESKDKDSISNAILAAQTGHRVYTTVHTSGVAITIPRMCAKFPESERRSMLDALVDATRGVVHQRLLRNKDGSGKVPIQEWLEFDNTVRSRLFGIAAERFIPEVRAMTEERGQSLLQDLQKKEALIHPEDYRRVLRELELEIERDDSLQE